MKKLLTKIRRNLTKAPIYKRESKIYYGNAKSMILKNFENLKNDEFVKIIEKYNETEFKDKEILKTGFTLFMNNVHKYTFDQINKVIKLYNISQLKDQNFNITVFNYIIKRRDALPLPITVNIFHNLVKSGLKDSAKVHIIKDHFLKNVDKVNSLDLTIILNSFTMLQEQLIGSSAGQLQNVSSNERAQDVTPQLKYNDLFTSILQKIKEEERIQNDLSVVNAVLILNLMSRINMCTYDIFKLFTKKYFKNLKGKDLEPHHYTLLLNSFAKCNVHINILKYIIKHMNNEIFINTLSYVNIMNALHYMAKFNYKNKYFVQNLKKRVETIIEEIPQRELSNIVWALSKLKHNDPSFNCVVFNQIEKLIHEMDPMSVAQVLDALRRNHHVNIQQAADDSRYVNQHGKDKNENENEKDNNNKNENKDQNVNNNQDVNNNQNVNNNKSKENSDELDENRKGNFHSNSIKTKSSLGIVGSSTFKKKHYDEREKYIVNLLIKRYLDFIENCSLHVLTQVPFCCLQLDCTDYEIYYKSLEMLRKKRKQMNTLNLIYAKYFIRIYIEKQENNFQRLPRRLKQFAKEILSSEGTS